MSICTRGIQSCHRSLAQVEGGPESALLARHGDVRIKKVSDPKILGPHDAIIKVRATVICGYDLHLMVASCQAWNREMYWPRVHGGSYGSRVGGKLCQKENPMTTKQQTAARRNIKKAGAAAKRARTITHLPKRIQTALGKQRAKAAHQKRAMWDNNLH